MSWIVVTLKPNQSRRAEGNLFNQGFTTFFPKITYLLDKKLVIKDLFPGYAFIKSPQLKSLVSINSTKGVSRIMRNYDSIPVIADQVIEKIMEQLKYLNSRLPPQASFKKNDKVIITLKIFNYQEAEVLEVCNKKDTQKVLLKILNSSQTFWINVHNLEPKVNLIYENIHC